MPTSEGAHIAEAVRKKAAEVKHMYEGVKEERASRAPAGRWSPKEVLSHLCGPEGRGYLPTLRVFLEQETPRIDIDPGNPFFTGKRSRMTAAELLAEFEREYERIATFVEGLSAEQLARKAHIPLLKESPLTEYPTLAVWAGAMGEYHVDSHLGLLKEILAALGPA